jgi:hypothetical protein
LGVNGFVFIDEKKPFETESSLMSALIWNRRALLTGLTSASVFGAAGSVAQENADGPLDLLISYRARPESRPDFQTYLSTTMTDRLTKLQQSGVLTSWQIVFSDYAGNATWDAMVLMRFSHYVDTQQWLKIERVSPGGLDAYALKWAAPYRTYLADIGWSGQALDMSSDMSSGWRDRVVLAIPYTYDQLATYKDFIKGYVLPQLDLWIASGILSRYRIYLNRYPVGDPEPWDSLFVYEYRNLRDFGRRDEILAQTRSALASNSAWSHWGQIKSTLRSESENTLAMVLAQSNA